MRLVFLGYGFSVIVKFTKKIGSCDPSRVEIRYPAPIAPECRPCRGIVRPSALGKGPLSQGKSYFLTPKMCFFHRKSVFLRREMVIHRMLIRIQYLLFVSLLVLLSGVPSMDRQPGRAGAGTTLSERQDTGMPSPARFCFATVCNGGEFAGLSEPAPGVKLPVRLNADLRSDVDPDFVASLQVRIYRAKIPAPTVDYYVFSLEHILI